MKSNPLDKTLAVVTVAVAAGVVAFLSIIRKAHASFSSEADDWGIKYAELVESGFCETTTNLRVFWRIYKVSFADKYRFAYKLEDQVEVEEMMSEDTLDEARQKGLEEIGCVT